MKNYTLIGYPLGHSMSPFIHERLFAAKNRPAQYTLTEIPPEKMAESGDFLRSLDGFNITIPHKMSVIPHLDELDESAQRYSSVNCVVNRDGRLIGYNTDCDGFTMSVADYPMDGRVLVVGCGGVGRMIATEAVRSGADLTIGIIEQDREMVEGFMAETREKYPGAKIRCALTAALDEGFDVLINASPVGMFPKTDACPVSDRLIEQADFFFDVIYNPTQTLLLKKARALGKTARGGAAMLVLQAVRAHEIWDGDRYTKAQIDQIITAMEAQIGGA